VNEIENRPGWRADGSLHRAIWAIALPSMLTNVATALFGLADLWVIGQLGDPAAQAGVEIGAKFMMGLLIVFNFLRSGTLALTSQAAGRADERSQAETLVRALGAALLIGLVLLALKPLATPVGLDLLYARGEVAAQASTYIGIRYWSALLWLANTALTGWLIGRRRVRAVLAIEVGANLTHIGLDLAFVLGAGWGVAGVATATFLSEGIKTIALALVTAREAPARALPALSVRPETWNGTALLALFRLNRDLFLRTLLLTASILALTRAGAHQGALVLAANGIIYQLFILSALILDGLESAAQVLCGEAVGARDQRRFGRLVHVLLLWGLAAGAVVSAAYALAGDRFAASFSTDPAVVATVLGYTGWAVALPLAGVTSYIFDGIYIGATWTRGLMLTMAAAASFYLILLFALQPLGNDGLWLAFTLFMLARAFGQALLLPGLRRRTFAADGDYSGN
jgi:MATE family multidrug resistance protein